MTGRRSYRNPAGIVRSFQAQAMLSRLDNHAAGARAFPKTNGAGRTPMARINRAGLGTSLASGVV